MKEVKVKVTQLHIDNGLPRSGFMCPVALAIKEATGIAYLLVTYHGMIDWKRKRVTKIKLPKEVTKFIQSFDAGEKVEPFSFLLKGQENE